MLYYFFSFGITIIYLAAYHSRVEVYLLCTFSAGIVQRRHAAREQRILLPHPISLLDLIRQRHASDDHSVVKTFSRIRGNNRHQEEGSNMLMR